MANDLEPAAGLMLRHGKHLIHFIVSDSRGRYPFGATVKATKA